MNEIISLNQGENYNHVSIGAFDSFTGKQFVKDASGATSCEISFGTLESGASIPFFHSHKANEENYIILSGSGEFMADNDTFTITQGSVIRVAPACRRNIKCTSSEPLVYICIQALENSLGDYTMTDAVI